MVPWFAPSVLAAQYSTTVARHERRPPAAQFTVHNHTHTCTHKHTHTHAA